MSKVPLVVDTNWLAERLEDPNLRLLDATTFLQHPKGGGYYDVWSGKEAYEKGHLPGAVFADLLEELSDPDSELKFTLPTRERFVEKISELGVGEGTYVVVYDQGELVNTNIIAPYWATRLAWQLRYEGFENVAILDGGFKKWIEEGRQVSTEPGAYPQGRFVGERQAGLIVNKDEVLQAIEDEDVIIIDSLSEAQYNGEVNSYGRVGHIPSSINVFFGSHSDGKSRELLDEETLRKKYEAIGALDPNKKVITYCGSAIAATWNATILNKLGQKNVAVYDGSLTEWAKDPNLPLTTKN